MPNKNFLLFFLLIAFFANAATAQESQGRDTTKSKSGLQWSNRDMTYRGKNYDVLDTSYIPKQRMKQQKKYLNHQSAFPAKPRNMWEAGFGLGLYNVIGNVPSLMLWQKGGGGLHVQVRKSWGYMFSTRLQYIYGVGKNLDNQPTSYFEAPYTTFGYVPAYLATSTNNATSIYRATRTETSQLNLDMMFSSHNISFNRERNQVSFFVYGGIGALGYKTRINALDGNYNTYGFTTNIVTDPTIGTKKIRKALQSKMDNTYETAAVQANTAHILDNKTLDFAPSLGVGVQYRINKSINIQLEERYTFTSDAYIDGSRFGTPLGDFPSANRLHDALNYFSLGVNFNIKNKKKSVEPLYWINPLDHIYQELSYPRHMILPNPVLPDEDGDGVTDQFDKCPKTPKEVPVDIHGCPLDTDGDGVPDYKDKQLITPTECQPVDADGVGHCPCPDGCGGEHGNGPHEKCGGITDGTLLFKGSKINETQEKQLATLASQMKAYPNCKVVVVGAGNGNKEDEERSWEHVNTVIEYMTEKNNISRDRFIFQYGKDGDVSIVNYHSANVDELGPQDNVNPPPPHPNLIKKN